VGVEGLQDRGEIPRARRKFLVCALEGKNWHESRARVGIVGIWSNPRDGFSIADGGQLHADMIILRVVFLIGYARHAVRKKTDTGRAQKGDNHRENSGSAPLGVILGMASC